MSELFKLVRGLVNDDRKGSVRQAVQQARRNQLAQSTIECIFPMRDSHWHRQRRDGAERK